MTEECRSIIDQLSKFTKQVSKVDNLQGKYEFLHKITQKKIDLSYFDEGDSKKAAFALRNIQECYVLLQE